MMAEAEATAATTGRQPVNLVCVKCAEPFAFERRPGSRGPAPRRCPACRYVPPRHNGHCRYCGDYVGCGRWRCDSCDAERKRKREARRTERERSARPPKQCQDCGFVIGNWKPGGNVIRCDACGETAYRAQRQRENVKRRKNGRSREEIIAECRERRARRDAERKLERERRQQARRTKPWLKPGLTIAEKFTVRYQHDPEFNLSQRLRAAFRRKRQGIRLDQMLRDALVRSGRSPRAERFVGYTVPMLRVHLERQFKKGMTWDRFCAGEIHIDHIRPLSSFDLSNPEDLRAAWALPNLRPLWAKDNLVKAGRLILLL